jgi:hypothetical protein
MFLTERKNGMSRRSDKYFFRRFKPVITPARERSSKIPFTENNGPLQGIQLVEFTA